MYVPKAESNCHQVETGPMPFEMLMTGEFRGLLDLTGPSISWCSGENPPFPPDFDPDVAVHGCAALTLGPGLFAMQLGCLLPGTEQELCSPPQTCNKIPCARGRYACAYARACACVTPSNLKLQHSICYHTPPPYVSVRTAVIFGLR